MMNKDKKTMYPTSYAESRDQKSKQQIKLQINHFLKLIDLYE